MSFRKTGYADPKTAPIRMRARFVESANELHQIDRVLKRVARLVVLNSTRPIAPERENVSNRRLSVSKENCFDFFFVVADAGQVRDRIQFCCVLNALDKIMGQISR